MRITDPDGVEWDVSRQWLHVPRWRVGRPSVGDALNVPVDGDGGLAGLAVLLLVIVALFLFLLVGLPLLVLLAGVVFAIGGLVIRILFGRPWLVRARSERGELEWRVRGALGSRRAIHEAAAALERGDRSVVPKRAERVLPVGGVRALR